jgi:Ni,Fe-hydrogenase I cytochrome b subunit
MNATLPIARAAATTSVSASTKPKRHSAMVRLTHWFTAIAFLALLITGGEIVLSHPRLLGRNREREHAAVAESAFAVVAEHGADRLRVRVA